MGADDPGDEQALATALSVIEHATASTRLLLAGEASRVEALANALEQAALATPILTLALEPGSTSAEAINAAIGVAFPGDLVLIAPGTWVTSRWLEQLTAAATSDSTIASATPLSLGGWGLELPDGDRAGSPEPSPDAHLNEAGVSRDGLRLRPRIATLGRGCVYLRRPAIDLVGPLKETVALDDALADFAVRALATGMVHVAADGVLVGGSTFAEGRPEATRETHASLDAAVRDTVENDERGRLRRAVAIARVATRPLSLTIDGRSLVAAVGGTQTYVLGLVRALAEQQRLALRVLVPPDLSERAGEALESLGDVELLSYEDATTGARLTDVVHRPQPIFTADDLTLLRLVGERVVIGQQDLIAYHNYSYHRNIDAWRAYRRTTRLSLAAADQVIFFSEHARQDVLGEDLLPAGRTHVVGVGADALDGEASTAQSPASLPKGEPFLFCLGADYAHKNRPFAIELLAGLRELGWSGSLIFAGPHVPFGSSREHEQQLLNRQPWLAEHVLDLGPVDEPTRNWLFKNARAIAYPTIYEGYGLLPLEAARAGVPCLFAPQASLSELAGGAATLVAWDPRASAAAVLPLLQDGRERGHHLDALDALQAPSWADVAGQLVGVYEQAVTAPAPEAAPRAWQELDREAYLTRLEREVEHLRSVAQEYQDAYHGLEGRLGVGLPLIDGVGLLSEDQQRGLLRVAGRRGFGAALLAPFGLLGKARVADRGGPQGDQRE